MPVLLETPVVQEAVVPKTYPIKWFYTVLLRFPGPAHEGSATIESYPMAEDGELYTKNGPDTLSIDDLFACANAKPSVAAAIQALQDAYPDIRAYLVEKAEAAAAAQNQE